MKTMKLAVEVTRDYYCSSTTDDSRVMIAKDSVLDVQQMTAQVMVVMSVVKAMEVLPVENCYCFPANPDLACFSTKHR